MLLPQGTLQVLAAMEHSTASLLASTMAAHAAPLRLDQFLTFRLGPDEFGLDVRHVTEIRAFQQTPPAAGAAHTQPGLLLLRGVELRLVDLRQHFGLGETATRAFSIVVVARLGHDLCGLLVDAVSDVVTIKPDQVLRLGEHATVRGLRGPWLGIATVDQRTLHLIDGERVLSEGSRVMAEALAMSGQEAQGSA